MRRKELVSHCCVIRTIEVEMFNKVLILRAENAKLDTRVLLTKEVENIHFFVTTLYACIVYHTCFDLCVIFCSFHFRLLQSRYQ